MATKLDRVPVASYLNADTDKLKIIKDNKGKSGIYRWTQLNSNKCYIVWL